MDGQKVHLGPHPSPLSLPPRGRDPLADERSPSGPPFSPERAILAAPQTEALQEGAPIDKGRDFDSSVQVVPDIGPVSRQGSLLNLEAGEQDQPAPPPPNPLPASQPGLPPGLAERLERNRARQARECLLRIPSLLQDNCPDPHFLENPRKDYSVPSPTGGKVEEPAPPKPMRLPAWA